MSDLDETLAGLKAEVARGLELRNKFPMYSPAFNSLTDAIEAVLDFMWNAEPYGPTDLTEAITHYETLL